MKEKKTSIKYKQWKELIEKKSGIKALPKQTFEIEKVINFIVFLNEVEQENLKLNSRTNENK